MKVEHASLKSDRPRSSSLSWKRVVVLGGAGFVGRTLCEKLVRYAGSGDATIVVPTRQRSHAKALQHLPIVEVVEADIFDPIVLQRVLKGAGAGINLVAQLDGTA